LSISDVTRGRDAWRRVCLSPAAPASWALLFVSEQRASARHQYAARIAHCASSSPTSVWDSLIQESCKAFELGYVADLVTNYLLPTGIGSLEACLILASQAYERGYVSVAMRWFQKACCFEPGRVEPLHNMSLMSRELDGATAHSLREAWLRRVSRLQPNNERVIADLLFERHLLGNDAGVLFSVLSQSTRTRDPVALSTLALLALEMGSQDDATNIVSRAIIQNPNHFIAYSKRATVALVAGEIQDAELALQRSQKLKPSALEPLINYARLLEYRGEMLSALDAYNEALRRRPDLNEPQLNSAIILLGLGQFTDGWKRYRSRWRARAVVAYDREKLSSRLVTTKPEFSGSSRSRLLIWAEQGLGDEIMFASMFHEAIRDSEKVIAQVDPRLLSLFRRSFPSIDFHKRIRPVPESDYDVQIALGDLGVIYRPDLNSFRTARHPYLSADLNMTDDLKSRYTGKRKIIGISWATENPDTGRYRSIDLEKFCQVFDGFDVELVNLQYKYDQAELHAVGSKRSLQIHAFRDIDNFLHIDRLASLISTCDLVITIGNATAHLAAALGVRTWVIVPLGGSWRWMFEGEVTPWYPSARIFRAHRQGDWGNVLALLRAQLGKFVDD
jgi:tetratricopeptide (TPR) repeat protein